MIVDKAVYEDGVRRACGDPSDELAALGSDPSRFVWIGLKDPTPDEFEAMNEELHLHPLAVEDAVHGQQRPKIDVYERSWFVVLKTLRYVEATSDVETGELMLFVGQNLVLTVRRGEVNPLSGVRQALERTPGMLSLGPVAVLHAILDQVVDTYLYVADELRQDLLQLEEEVFSGGGPGTGTAIYQLKREVLEFKRAAIPLEQPLRRLLTSDMVGKKTRPFFADVLDHLMAVMEHAESYDRLLSDMLNVHLAQQGVQQNADMRKISAWVAIAAVPTMIAAIYGMNFENMPELRTQNGYFVCLGVMAAVCVVLYILLRRSRWL